MAIAKQPTPTAIRMISSMNFLLNERQSGDAESPQRHDDREGDRQMQSERDADLERDLAHRHAIGRCLRALSDIGRTR